MQGDVQSEPQAVFDLIAKRLLSLVRVSRLDRLLDVACGSWPVGREAARQRIRFVAGIDINLARLRAGGSHTSCQARAEALPFSDDEFSLVTCQHGLMFFDDRAAALREAARVLRDDGQFAATCWCALEESPGFLALHRAIAKDLGPRAPESAARPFSLPNPEMIADEFAAAGFANVTIDRMKLRIASRSAEDFASWYLLRTSLAPFVDGREKAVTSICRRVAEDLTSFLDANSLDVPAEAYCVRARRL